MDSDTLARVLREGESQTVEFVLTLPSDKLAARVLTAFANTNGGILLVGVADDGTVVGLGETEGQYAFQRLTKLTTSLFTWPVTVAIFGEYGKRLLYADVPPASSQFRPVTTAEGEVWIRQGTEDLLAPQAFPPRSVLELQRAQASAEPGDERVLFVAMSFREEQEPALVDYFEAIKRAVQRSGKPIRVVRIDLEQGDFEVSQNIMDRINQAHIVLADFTLSPANVYFELGFARGQGKRIIQTARKETQLEFDTRNWHTVFYRNATELEAKLLPELVSAFDHVR